MATERPRIASALLLAGATLAVAATLGAVYGGAHLRSRVIENSTPNALNTAYLEAWLRSTPSDPIYLKALGEQYLGLGRLDDAQSVAARLAALGTPAARQAGNHLLLRCELLRAFMAKPGSTERATHVAQARALLTAMIAETWTPAQLQWLATQALAINVPDIAARYDERLVAADPARRLHWQREAARQYLATAAYREAASAYFAAQSMAATRDEARRDFIAGVGALQAGNLLDEALTQGNVHLGALSQDRATLEVMLALARAANRPELVERYARALMPFVSQRAPGAGAMRLAAVHADSAPQRGKWLRLAGIEPFGHAARMRAHRASGEIVEAGYAAGQPVRLLRVAAAAAPDPAPAPVTRRPATSSRSRSISPSSKQTTSPTPKRLRQGRPGGRALHPSGASGSRRCRNGATSRWPPCSHGLPMRRYPATPTPGTTSSASRRCSTTTRPTSSRSCMPAMPRPTIYRSSTT